jgi:hypothetical protein
VCDQYAEHARTLRESNHVLDWEQVLKWVRLPRFLRDSTHLYQSELRIQKTYLATKRRWSSYQCPPACTVQDEYTVKVNQSYRTVKANHPIEPSRSTSPLEPSRSTIHIEQSRATIHIEQWRATIHMEQSRAISSMEPSRLTTHIEPSSSISPIEPSSSTSSIDSSRSNQFYQPSLRLWPKRRHIIVGVFPQYF